MSAYERYVEAYRHTIEASIALGGELTDPDWAAPTECPLWTVGDIYAHLAGGERWMASGHNTSAPPGGFSQWVDSAVLARRDNSRAAVLDELREVYRQRQAQLAEPTDPGTPAVYPWGGATTLEGLMSIRAFDCWVHEQDIRRAVGQPGNLGSPAARLTADTILRSTPRVVAKQAGAPPGASVRLVATGEVPVDVTIRVHEEGRASAVPPDGLATAELRMTWEAFSRLACGRGEAAAYPIEVSGDRDLAARVLANFAITP